MRDVVIYFVTWFFCKLKVRYYFQLPRKQTLIKSFSSIIILKKVHGYNKRKITPVFILQACIAFRCMFKLNHALHSVLPNTVYISLQNTHHHNIPFVSVHRWSMFKGGLLFTNLSLTTRLFFSWGGLIHGHDWIINKIFVFQISLYFKSLESYFPI